MINKLVATVNSPSELTVGPSPLGQFLGDALRQLAAQTCSEGLRLFQRKADLALRP